jgi:diguanylate cyclase (GGDEF)-like protein
VTNLGQTERLLQIIQAQNEIVSSELDLESAMALIAERAASLTEAGGAAIATPEPDALVFRAAHGAISPQIGDRYALERSLGGRCLAEGRVLVADDCVADPRVDDRICQEIGARSIICVPLVHHREVLGVLSAYADTRAFFDTGDVSALELVGETISAHLHHSRSFATEAHRSRHDSLTGLLNRRAYEERLPIELARAARTDEPISLCLLDLDGFKAINDRHGHPVGDEVLRSVAAAIKRARLSDEVFRLGGDEFAILLPSCRRLDAEVALARLLAAINVSPIIDLEPSFGVTYGIASAIGGDAVALHADADRELLGAKHRLYTERTLRSARRGLLGAAA